MNSFLRIFFLELTSLVRSKTFALLALASAAWMFVFPYIVKGDGTIEGARELYIRFSLGGVFALLAVSLLAGATASIASERAAKRLDLTMVRPVAFFFIASGKVLAHVAVGAVILAIASAILLLKVDAGRPCSHVYSPRLPTPQEEARMMYDVFMNSPETPEAVKKAKKSTVMRILAQRARDHYRTVVTNAAARWKFDPALYATCGDGEAKMRFRLTNANDMRQDVKGSVVWGDRAGSFSSMTGSFIEVPLVERAASTGAVDEVIFKNDGALAIMLRPRQDVHLLIPADAFAFNLLRAYVVMLSLLALLVSFGVFLSASLSRPVALFTAVVLLVVGEISPSVVEQYPDQLETDLADRIGLHITRFSASLTSSLSSSSPLEALSRDECVEASHMLRMAVVDFVLLGAFFSLLAAFVMRQRQR